jgi:hypothetical protein
MRAGGAIPPIIIFNRLYGSDRFGRGFRTYSP